VALDGRILARAKARLEEKKRAFEARREARLNEVYDKCPRIRLLDREIKSTMVEAIGLALRTGQDPKAVMTELRDKNLYLQSERIQALLSAGLTPEDIENEYMCSDCRDTGYIGTDPCGCLLALYQDEQKKALSNLFKLGDESFDNFELAFYSTAPEPGSVLSPRQKMEIVFDTCRDYAMEFERPERRTENLYLSGPTGLGKTFLSACIARVVAEKGFSVVYDTASAVFAKFEVEKFSKSDDLSAARDDIRRYLSCDLMIMDDLGTEMTTSFTISALYHLVNTRLTSGRKTIINSNLPAEELGQRYSPPIASRIEGHFHVLRFYGSDIRLLKKGI
jgi:DNA replication protein DnaC